MTATEETKNGAATEKAGNIRKERSTSRHIIVLASGDLVAFLAFSAIGRGGNRPGCNTSGYRDGGAICYRLVHRLSLYWCLPQGIGGQSAQNGETYIYRMDALLARRDGIAWHLCGSRCSAVYLCSDCSVCQCCFLVALALAVRVES